MEMERHVDIAIAVGVYNGHERVIHGVALQSQFNQIVLYLKSSYKIVYCSDKWWSRSHKYIVVFRTHENLSIIEANWDTNWQRRIYAFLNRWIYDDFC